MLSLRQSLNSEQIMNYLIPTMLLATEYQETTDIQKGVNMRLSSRHLTSAKKNLVD